MKLTGLVMLAAMAVAGSTQAQSYQRIHDQLFCNQQGNYAYQAMVDYRNGVAFDSAEQRADGYVCADMQPICDIRRNTLRKVIALSYKIGDGENVRGMTAADYLSLNDLNRTETISTCMEVARQ